MHKKVHGTGTAGTEGAQKGHGRSMEVAQKGHGGSMEGYRRCSEGACKGCRRCMKWVQKMYGRWKIHRSGMEGAEGAWKGCRRGMKVHYYKLSFVTIGYP